MIPKFTQPLIRQINKSKDQLSPNSLDWWARVNDVTDATS